MGNYVESHNVNYWGKVREYQGKRIPDLFCSLRISRGWVVGDLPEDVKERIKTKVFPLEPSNRFQVASRNAQKEVEYYKSIYCQSEEDDIYFLILQDNKKVPGLSVGPIIKSDLFKEPEDLIYEGIEALRDGDEDLSEMKRRACIAITDNRDISWEA